MALSWIQLSGSFDPNKDIPDLSGKVILVTGGNIGLGRETILQVAQHNPKHIYLAARTESKARDAIAGLQKEVPSAAPTTWLPLDLSSFDSIKAAADTFNKSSDRLDYLFNNAGVMAAPAGQTKEGYEMQFGTNHVGHALLTKLLLPTLLKTAKRPGSDVRIINLSSSGHQFPPKGAFVWDSLKTDMAAWSTWTRYGQSKLANIHFTRSLAQKYPEIKSVAVHPGAVATNLTHSFTGVYGYVKPLLGVMNMLVSLPVEKGTLNQLWAAFSPKAESGSFYNPVGNFSKGSAYAQDEKLSEQLWDWTEKELKEHGF